METPDSDDGIYGRLDGTEVQSFDEATRPDLGSRGALSSIEPLGTPETIPETRDDLADISDEWAIGYVGDGSLMTMAPVEEVQFDGNGRRIRIGSYPHTIRINNGYTTLFVDGIVVRNATEIPIENVDVAEYDRNGFRTGRSESALVDEIDIPDTRSDTGHEWYRIANTDDRSTRGPNSEGALFLRRSDIAIPDEYSDSATYSHLPIDITRDAVLDGWELENDEQLSDFVIQATEIRGVDTAEVPGNR